MQKNLIKGYTLVEMILSISLFAMIIIIAFQIVGNMWVMKVKQSNRIDVTQDMFYTIESLTSTIKDFWWDIDYEEYWNRKIVWEATSSWHYSIETWFWNYWNLWNISTNSYGGWYYVCRSWNSWATPWSQFMWTWWCVASSSFNFPSNNYSWQKQRYWEYSFHFIDYNSNQTADASKPWDEDWDWNIQWDDDDENLWMWPVAFSWSEVKELYLVKKWRNSERLYFRLNFKKDKNLPNWANCNSDWTWTWCVWNIQILRLTWKDHWFNHISTLTWAYDWKTDTWSCAPNFLCSWTNNLPNWIDDGWVDLLPGYVNVKNLKLFLYPNKDYKYWWKENDTSLTVNPFVRISMTIWYSWDRRKKLNWADPTTTITTSINLTKN
ncbi:MAG: hypothetical protein ACD_3C00060G0003 [uncultured bacterium (gcode 4)]|uniref:Prepilin-type N-terminal cleavage/methylation domain-containing protein n=1 Tax=uncultured bacterium (gcode 4) TaxID=1234023 RepID=K2FZM7_9BACT|nr:MAG: hypothetical protein ACD_3C00060G0003 [uncultured bacterium (gcode 4)]